MFNTKVLYALLSTFFIFLDFINKYQLSSTSFAYTKYIRITIE